jgi:hypothetical protein
MSHLDIRIKNKGPQQEVATCPRRAISHMSRCPSVTSCYIAKIPVPQSVVITFSHCNYSGWVVQGAWPLGAEAPTALILNGAVFWDRTSRTGVHR